MKKIMFDSYYGLEQAVLKGSKTMTRRIISKSDEDWFQMQYGEEYERWIRNAPFMYREVLAVAQSYKDLGYPSDTIQTGRCIRRGSHHPENEWDDAMIGQRGDWFIDQLAGWENKMFVTASMCKHHIRITDIKVERLKDISKEDCLKEGIDEDHTEYGDALYWVSVPHEGISWEEYRKRSYELSCHELDGKKGEYFWDSPQKAFAALIDKISGKGTWNRNPFVFAYTFKLED